MERLADLPDTAKKIIFGVIAVALGVLVVFANLDDTDTEADTAVTASGPVLAEDEVVAPQESPGVAEPSSEESQAALISLEAPVGEKSLREAAETAVEFVEVYVGYDWRDDAERRGAVLQAMAAETNTINTSGVGSLYAQDRQVVTTIDILGAAPTLISPSTVVFAVQAATSTTAKGVETPAEVVSVMAVSMVAENQKWKVVSVETAGASEVENQEESTTSEFQDGGSGGQ